MLADGSVDINGTVIDTDGKITTKNGAMVDSDVETAAGVTLDGHTHPSGPTVTTTATVGAGPTLGVISGNTGAGVG